MEPIQQTVKRAGNLIPKTFGGVSFSLRSLAVLFLASRKSMIDTRVGLHLIALLTIAGITRDFAERRPASSRARET
jgi:hypothetical protein